MMAFDLSLYGIFDADVVPGLAVRHALQQAVAGGMTLVQLRQKQGSARSFLGLAHEARAALAGSSCPLIINDRVDIAAACGADGVHIGQDDVPAEAARRILGDDAIIGLTVRSAEEVLAAPVDIIDYVGLGGVFATASKNNETAPLGIEGFRLLRSALRQRRADLPVCAIAGINASNCGEVIAAGADGVAVISALFAADDITIAATSLAQAVRAARGGTR